MIPTGVRIFAAAAPVDMRRGFAGLAEAARTVLAQDPGSGALFLFVNKRRDKLKLLWHDRTGFCLLYKALDHRGFFRIPEGAPGAASVVIDAVEMAAILEGVQLPIKKAATSREIARRARNILLPQNPICGNPSSA